MALAPNLPADGVQEADEFGGHKAKRVRPAVAAANPVALVLRSVLEFARLPQHVLRLFERGCAKRQQCPGIRPNGASNYGGVIHGALR